MRGCLARIDAWDRQAMLWVRRTPAITWVFLWITRTGVGRAWIAVCVSLVLLQRAGLEILPDQTGFLRCTICSLVAWALGTGLKRVFKRLRPFQAMPGFAAAARSPLHDSFPSLHAGSTFALFVALLRLGHPLAPWVGLWSALATFSRYYLGVHYPSDLAGGMALGTACGLLVGPIGRLGL